MHSNEKRIRIISRIYSIVLLASSEHDLDRAPEEMTGYYRKYHLTTGRNKTKTTTCQKPNRIHSRVFESVIIASTKSKATAIFEQCNRPGWEVCYEVCNTNCIREQKLFVMFQ